MMKIASTPKQRGLSDNLIGAVAYLTPAPALFFLAVQRYNKRPYVRFHSWQSIVFYAFLFLFFRLFQFCLRFIAFLGPHIILAIVALVSVSVFITWLWCVISALNGKSFKLPFIGKWADDQAYR